jgi:hypothetical protein
MKTTTLLCLAALTAFTQQPAHAAFRLYDGVYTMSADHPETWVAGADRVHQDLRWDKKTNMLVADVKYSTNADADKTFSPAEDDFTLTFPGVRFDAAKKVFTVDGATIAQLKDGFFGPVVVLNKGIALSIHRHRGIIYAAIIRDYANGY